MIDSNSFFGNTKNIDFYGADAVSWNNVSASFGSAGYMYYEDNTFHIHNTPHSAGGGGKYCARFNTYVFSRNTGLYPWFDMHGNQPNAHHAAMAAEIYGNTLTMTHDKGGAGMIFDNIVTGGYRNVILANNYRSTRAYAPWGKCDGSSRWDGNQEPNGYPAIDQIGRSTDSGPGPPQELDPLYEWGNTLNGEDADIAVADDPAVRLHIKAGRDFHNDAEKLGYTPFAYPHSLMQKTEASPRKGPNK